MNCYVVYRFICSLLILSISSICICVRPDLEEKRQNLIVESARNKKILKETEDNMLQIMTTSGGNLLEDQDAVDVLDSSKVYHTAIYS